MISRDDDRWSGHLATIGKSADGLIFSFKSDFQETPLELLESDVSTVFMADKGAVPKSETLQPFVLLLQDEGMLHVTSCSFTEDAVSAVHPLLGSLTIRRSGVAALKRFESKSKEEAPEE